MNSVEIRRFADTDWPGLWEVWHEVVAAGESYDNDPASSESDARAHWTSLPGFEVWVAVEDGDVLGTYKVGPNKGKLGAHVANASFMVSSRARGRGLGRTLGEHCLDRARQLGFTAMQFNAVVSTNTVAVRLWRSLGFIIVGTIPDGFQSTKHGLVDFHIMHRYL
ncbi:GNAT family N-acetyltransferase [Dactylosporangium sp. AC04546]|uniref:GNAT family N-acetyltransferase n=1 Tax=Dactylosporangium sp. AC04546 TaxID=2862460 RepID=UPI001EDF3E85|nr:GNAT family N-acetyltransferase [Dactylosporangium sp. AC04546]WVK84944.1 GNAT family N-acetyltransferase [Dactylosporangium sp. AC04546]